MRNVISFLKRIVWRIKGNYNQNEYEKRINKLIERGLKIGCNVTIDEGAFIDRGYPYLISIGDNCSIGDRVVLLAHDDTILKFTGGYARVGKIVIKENCFIGQYATILPGVTIGPNVTVAAGSLVNRNIPPNSCVAGNPARIYMKFDEMMKKHKEKIKSRPVFKYSDVRMGQNIKREKLEELKKAVEDGICYIQGKGDAFKKMTWNI